MTVLLGSPPHKYVQWHARLVKTKCEVPRAAFIALHVNVPKTIQILKKIIFTLSKDTRMTPDAKAY